MSTDAPTEQLSVGEQLTNCKETIGDAIDALFAGIWAAFLWITAPIRATWLYKFVAEKPGWSFNFTLSHILFWVYGFEAISVCTSFDIID